MPSPSEKKKKKSGNVELDFKKDLYEVLFTFNRAGIEPLATGDLLIHLGMVNSSGQIAAFAFVLEMSHCASSIDSWTTYLEKVGGPKEEGDESFRVTPSLLRHSFLPTVNYLNWHRTGTMGELRALSFSLADVYAAASTGAASVPAQAIALLRCPLEVQMQLLFNVLNRAKSNGSEGSAP